MLPDAKWLDALSLPTKVIGGLFAFFVVSLLVHWKITPLLAPTWWSFFVLGTILTGCLFGASMIAFISMGIQERQKPAMIANRRKAVKDEQNREREKARDRIVKKLDHLSSEEMDYVADALRNGSPAFKAWSESGDLANMMARGLISTPGGTHHQDHYPFFFHDFVWEVMLRRKDEFIAKDDENKRKAAEAKKRR